MKGPVKKIFLNEEKKKKKGRLTLHLTAENPFFSSIRGTPFRIDHMLDHKTKFNIF